MAATPPLKVAATCLQWVFDLCRQHGIAPGPADASTIPSTIPSTMTRQIDWGDFERYLVTLRQFADPGELELAGLAAWQSATMQRQADVGRLLFNVKDQFAALYGPAGSTTSDYSLESTFSQTAPGCLQIRLEPPVRTAALDTLGYFLKGQMRRLPGIYHLGDAQVAFSYEAGALDFKITHEEISPGIRSLLRARDRWSAATRLAISAAQTTARPHSRPAPDLYDVMISLDRWVGRDLQAAFWHLDRHHQVIWASRSVEFLLGATPDELAGLSWLRMIDAPDIENYLSARSAAAQQADPSDPPLPLKLKHRDGHRMPVNLRFLRQNRAGTLLVTANRPAVAARELHAAAEIDAVLSIDRQSRISFANSPALELLGCAATDLHQVAIQRLIPDALADSEVRLALQPGARVSAARGSVRLLKHDRTLATCELVVLGQHTAADGHRMLVLRDLSPQEALKAEQAALALKMQRLQQHDTLGQVSSEFLHDFNNLLVAILGYSDLAGQSGNNGQVESHLAEIRAAAERGRLMTKRLLAYGREQAFEPALINLVALVTGASDLLLRLMPPGIRLSVSVPEQGVLVMADRLQLEQVLINLAVNARDAMPAGGEMSISVSSDPAGEAAICVTDSGNGMDAETQARAFDPFFSTKTEGRGTGLGLAIIRQIVDRHEGRISLQSAPGSGTRVTMTLPLAKAGAPVSAALKRTGQAVGGSETILLVEDDDQVRTLARLILTAAGYTVHEAADGDQGLYCFNEHRAQIDLVLVDVLLPGTGSQVLAQVIRRTRPAMPLLFISGYGREHALVSQVIDDGWPLLEKPFGPAELRIAVRQALDQLSGAARQAP